MSLRNNRAVMEVLETPDAFAAYLQMQEIAGATHDSCDCPIARFLNDEFFTPGGFEVTETAIHTPWGLETVEPPKWVQDFVSSIQTLPYDMITSTQALDILK